MQSFNDKVSTGVDQYLLRAIAEELQLPLTRIARFAELGHLQPGNDSIAEQFKSIEYDADIALQLVDSYLIGLQLAEKQQQLDLEPVSLASVLNETAHKLSGIARQYNIDLELSVNGRQPLVMANATGLRAAFLNIGSTLVTSQPSNPKARQVVTLASYHRKDSLVAGIFGNQSPITPKVWQRAGELYGRASQPLLNLGSTNGAGLFVADTIFRAMSSKLRPAKNRQQQGLAATLKLSQQLELV